MNIYIVKNLSIDCVIVLPAEVTIYKMEMLDYLVGPRSWATSSPSQPPPDLCSNAEDAGGRERS